MIHLTLPLPPTINHYYGQSGKRKYIKAAGQVFRLTVAEIVAGAGHATLEGRLGVFASIFPANRIKQDLDNRQKALLDALTHAGVWLDDSQIDALYLLRREVIKGGKVEIIIMELQEATL